MHGRVNKRAGEAEKKKHNMVESAFNLSSNFTQSKMYLLFFKRLRMFFCCCWEKCLWSQVCGPKAPLSGELR